MALGGVVEGRKLLGIGTGLVILLLMYEYVYFWMGVFCFIVTGDGCLEWKLRHS